MFLGSNAGSLCEPVTQRRWDRAELQTQVATRVAAYQAAGLAPGDRCLILFGNRLEFFAELLAIWNLGACAIPVDTRLTDFELGNLVKASQPKLAILDDSRTAPGDGSLSGVQLFNTLDQPHAHGAPEPTAGLHLDNNALILFTSGSTGQPKGVVHTFRSLLARWISLDQALGRANFARTLCVLPTHFGHGLICNCLFPWLTGNDLFISPPFRADLIMSLGKLIDEHGISFMSSVPSVWNLALKASAPPKLSSLQRIHIGSAPLSASLWRQVQEWSGTRNVCNAYGITETGSWVAGLAQDNIEPMDGLIGEPWGAQLKISTARTVAELATGAVDCPAGEEGMIWLNTPALMKEYYQLPDVTSAAIYNGWFNTGDIGVVDELGRLTIRGRERDEINKGGMKIFPADIDAIVADDPNVVDVCTFGIDDAAYGENVALAVVLQDAKPQRIISLHERLVTHLAAHKQPVTWYLLEEIPRTSRGKINRTDVRDRCGALEPLDLYDIISPDDHAS